MPNLQTLSVSSSWRWQTPSYYRFILANLVAPNLQYIRLNLELRMSNTIEVKNSNWAEMDHLLGSPAFGSLRGMKVILRLNLLPSSCQWEINQLVDQFVKQFPQLVLMGILDVEVMLLWGDDPSSE
jgi:hypothetical protein